MAGNFGANSILLGLAAGQLNVGSMVFGFGVKSIYFDLELAMIMETNLPVFLHLQLSNLI